MDKKSAEKMTYEWYADRRLKFIKSCNDSETLHLCVFNYNWTNGFDEPKAYIANPNCSLSTALQLFYDGDGIRVLSNDLDDDEIEVYRRIVAGEFKTMNIKFEPPVSDDDLNEMKKELKPEEMVFITPIEGTDCNIQL